MARPESYCSLLSLIKGIDMMCTMKQLGTGQYYSQLLAWSLLSTKSQTDCCLKMLEITNKTTSPWAVPLCAARNRPICHRR